MKREELGKLLRDAAKSGEPTSSDLLMAAAEALDDSDRRAGAAERALEYARDTEFKRSSWLHGAKTSEGYADSTPFDDVWDNLRAERDRLRVAVETDPVKADTERLDWLAAAVLGIDGRSRLTSVIDRLAATPALDPAPLSAVRAAIDAARGRA